MPWCGTWETSSGLWWLFPLLCLVVMGALAFVCFRAFGCWGRRAGRGDREIAELQRELQELREDFRKLRSPS